MNLFQLFRQPDINSGVREYDSTPGAVLIDVRTPAEYSEGHIPGSKHIPLQTIDRAARIAENKGIPLFVYCYSGARSRQATGLLQKMGYTNVNNIGGIAAYTGKMEA
ncbi:MAG: rhodanese-like domain-containing protein [Eubacteriales bacterium]|nr:rhodanese-like domain-containing protein [Eubacteriales bacterium]